jgi:hypothetical protein
MELNFPVPFSMSRVLAFPVLETTVFPTFSVHFPIPAHFFIAVSANANPLLAAGDIASLTASLQCLTKDIFLSIFPYQFSCFLDLSLS